MASVASLDKDLRKLRLDKYTPAAAGQARSWIEDVLGEKLPGPDLLLGLKDGVALCKLVNRALPPPGVKFKQSPMPFVQMENISLFLNACRAPHLNLHQHDVFLTVDLYEQKDPAQVLQCLGAFSRAANAANPDAFPTTIGPRSRAGGASPQLAGPASPLARRDRGASITSNVSSACGSARPVLPHRTGESASGRWSPAKSPARSPTRSPTRSHAPSPSNGGSPSLVSTWNRKEQETVTSPAWNIAQYGYMGGASQGNLGISFGGRRQITGAEPQVPSLADKVRLRREEEERQRHEADEEQRRRRAEIEAEEQARREERRWEEETERLRDEERRRAQEEQRQWGEQERQWQQTEQKRRQEEREAQARLEEERRRVRSRSDHRLRGQFLSQYQAEAEAEDSSPSAEVRELERALERARQREAEYERERQQRLPRPGPAAAAGKAAPRPPPLAQGKTRVDSWSTSERELLQTTQGEQPQARAQAQAPAGVESPGATYRPAPGSAAGSRPLPDPARYSSPTSQQPSPSQPSTTPSRGPEEEPAEERCSGSRDGDDEHAGPRAQARAGPAAAAWASKSLLEREMELERQRQREWEEMQKETAAQAARPAARRHIAGPRPLPGSSR